MNLPLVVCTWNDAHVEADVPISLENVGDTHRPTVVTTIGWVLRHDDVGISLANEYYDECYRGRTFIYAPMIISVVPYNLSKPRKKRSQPCVSEPPS